MIWLQLAVLVLIGACVGFACWIDWRLIRLERTCKWLPILPKKAEVSDYLVKVELMLHPVRMLQQRKQLKGYFGDIPARTSRERTIGTDCHRCAKRLDAKVFEDGRNCLVDVPEGWCAEAKDAPGEGILVEFTCNDCTIELHGKIRE